MSTKTRLIAGAAICVLALANCGSPAQKDRAPDETSAAPQPTVTESPSDVVTEPEPTEDPSPPQPTMEETREPTPTIQYLPPETVDASSKFEETVGGDLILLNAEIHRAEDQISIDLTFTGPGTIEYEAKYVEEAIRQGIGEPTDVPGGAILQVMLRGVTWSMDIEEFSGPISDGPIAIVYDGAYEGQSFLFIGMAEPAPYRVVVHEPPTQPALTIYLEPSVASGGSTN